MQDVNELSWKNVPGNFGPMREASANARFTGPCGFSEGKKFVNQQETRSSL